MLTDSNCLLGQEEERVLLSSTNFSNRVYFIEMANARVDSVNYLSEDPYDCDCSYREVFCQKVSIFPLFLCVV